MAFATLEKRDDPLQSQPLLGSTQLDAQSLISMYCPPGLAKDIQTLSPQKQEQIGSALSAFHNKFYGDNQLASMPDSEKIQALFSHQKIGQALILDAGFTLQNIGSIIENAGDYAGDAIAKLTMPKTGSIFASNQDAFARISEAAGTGAGPAYALFEKMAEDLDVAKMADMVIGIANSQGGGAWGAMYALGYPSTFKLFEQDFKNGTSITADALKEFLAVPENARGAALYCFSKPFWGERLSDSQTRRFFVSIGQAYGAMSEATFTDLKDKEIGPFVLSNLAEFSNFIQNTSGDNRFAYSFVAFANKSIRDWVAQNPAERLQVLTKDASAFTSLQLGPMAYSDGPIGFFSWLESKEGSEQYLSRK